MFNRCKHKWRVLSETTTESKFSHAMSVSGMAGHGKVKVPHQMCCADRKFIQITVCDLCGKQVKFVEHI